MSAQPLAALAGVVFLLVGVLGLVPGITTHYGGMSLAGRGSDARLLGVFQVSLLHDAVHVAFGVGGLVLAKTAEGAHRFLLGGGIAFLALWLLGLGGAASWLPANAADNWLHFAFGAALLVLGAVARGASSGRS
jgi:hypothetical protein